MTGDTWRRCFFRHRKACLGALGEAGRGRCGSVCGGLAEQVPLEPVRGRGFGDKVENGVRRRITFNVFK